MGLTPPQGVAVYLTAFSCKATLASSPQPERPHHFALGNGFVVHA